MKDQTINNLKVIFDKFDEKKNAENKLQEEIKTEKDLFLENFSRAITNTIRPALQEMNMVRTGRK